jgi:hypothetical protein
MLKNELRLRERAYRNGWLRERKLHLIWRAMARRHLSRLRELRPYADADWRDLMDNDGESDP